MDESARLQGIDRGTLTPVVRRVLDSDTAEVADWTIGPVKRSGRGVRLGMSSVHRVLGTATVGKRALPWSVILKLLAPTPQGMAFVNEADVYRSGLISDLPHDLVAPRCYGADDLSDSVAYLWLEDVADSYGRRWSLERYGLAARHLGQFSGLYLTERPLPNLPWLSRDRIRALTAWTEARGTVESLLENLDHPLMRRAFPPEIVERLLGLWRGRATLLDALDRLPQTFCHGDAFRRNLLTRRRTDGHEQTDGREETVAIDWDTAGVSALGVEIAPLVGNSILIQEIPLSDLWSLEERVFEGYVSGLRDVGWRGDERLVRLGYTASIAVRCCWPAPAIPKMLLDPESYAGISQHFGLEAPPEEVADGANQLGELALRRGAEARELLPLVG